MRAGIARRISAVLAAILVAVSAAGLLAATTTTEAAWADRTTTTAVVQSGIWAQQPAVGCSARNPAGNAALVSCATTHVSYTESGAPGSRARVYTVSVRRTFGDGYAQVTIDLSTASGPASSFSWSTAAVATTSTVLTDWTCWSMPIVQFDTPTFFTAGLISYSYSFTVFENGATAPGACT